MIYSNIKIRQLFLDFFKEKGHHYVAPAPLVHTEDPSLLFTNAGMNQFKNFFINHQAAPYQRVTNIQPCLRVAGKHNDLAEVGTDAYHHTLFEMMGTWSFGEYFKEDAIAWAWELLTCVYKLPIDRLYVTVFTGDKAENLATDTESLAIWQQYVKPSHIIQGNKKDNFWEMGDTGPCGPCSEIHIDIRSLEEVQQLPGKELVNTGHPHVIEIWNLVFIQYNRATNGQLTNLPTKHVDTGMGLERLTMALQHKQATYETDLFIPLIHNIMRLSDKRYGEDQSTDIAMQVISDHIRAVTFTIAEGQLPGNTQAGYVIRKILRRAVRYGYTYLGFREAFMHELVSILAQQFQYIYPQIRQQHTYIAQLVKNEEEAFLKILNTGLHQLEKVVETLQKDGHKIIDGATVFELYDTHGFPLEVIQMVAEEKGLRLDESGFQQALQEQRNRSKKAIALMPGEWHILRNPAQPRFVGYDQLQAVTQLVQYRSVHQKGQEYYQVVLEETPFYPESGGQVGDTGQLIVGDQTITVLDTKKEGEWIIHYISALPTDPHAIVKALVDENRRTLIANNHTATHLLQAALQRVLGPQVEQKGSLVNPDYLRFDFSYQEKLTPVQLQTVEQVVNQKIRDNIAIEEVRNMPIEAARALGVMALFSEKYGTHVRMISCDSTFSRELCGGTHARTTGQLGFFKIIAESSVAAGTRRIEALTAKAAEDFVNTQFSNLQQVIEVLKNPKDPIKTLHQLLTDKAEMEKKLQAYEGQALQDMVTRLMLCIKEVKGIQTILQEVKAPSLAALKQLGINLRKHTHPLFVTLVTLIEEKPYIMVAIADGLVQNTPLNANTIIKELSTHIAGEGGGQPFLATAQGKNPQGLQEVLNSAQRLIEAIV